MNPWHLPATGLLVWGIVAHLVADWPLQNDWLAANKSKRLTLWKRVPGEWTMAFRPYTSWWARHPAAWLHAIAHGALLWIVFGWPAAPVAFAHLLIDTRKPVEWWSRLVGQTAPEARQVLTWPAGAKRDDALPVDGGLRTLYDMGVEVRLWMDQVFHIVCIAAAALLVG